MTLRHETFVVLLGEFLDPDCPDIRSGCHGAAGAP
jgi:hypothetical protein